MNKLELVDVMAAKAGISKVVAKKALDAFIEATQEGLKKDQRVSLPGFATLKVVNRPAGLMRNVRTGEKMQVPAKNLVKFKAGTVLLDSVQ
jgi:DNA-binding protein HU-beta